MYETFNIQSKSTSYTVKIGTGYITASNSVPGGTELVLIDRQVAKLWPSLINESAVEIEAIEELKTLDTAAQLIEQLRLRGANRNSHILSIGGGIVQDLSTFVSSVYMRGVDWIYCPTTLLGMVDSCVGGKSSLNVGKFKNIAGNFYPPKEIWIDVAFCKTLSPIEKTAGLCEAVKICYADEGVAFDRYLALVSDAKDKLSDQFLIEMIDLTLKTKKRFIEEDEFDAGIRLLLNFGHTFGHAIEAATQFSISHGVAVGLGMLAEARLASLLNGWQSQSARFARLESYILRLLASVPDLNSSLSGLSIDEAIQAFKSDKKHDQQSYFVIMPNLDGYLTRVNLPITPELDKLVTNIFSDFKRGISL